MTDIKKETTTMSTENTTATTGVMKKHRCDFGIACRFFHEHLFCIRFKKEEHEEVKAHCEKFFHPPLICQGHGAKKDGECNRVHYYDAGTEKANNRFLCPFDMNCRNKHCQDLHGWKCHNGNKCDKEHCVKYHPRDRNISDIATLLAKRETRAVPETAPKRNTYGGRGGRGSSGRGSRRFVEPKKVQTAKKVEKVEKVEKEPVVKIETIEKK